MFGLMILYARRVAAYVRRLRYSLAQGLPAIGITGVLGAVLQATVVSVSGGNALIGAVIGFTAGVIFGLIPAIRYAWVDYNWYDAHKLQRILDP